MHPSHPMPTLPVHLLAFISAFISFCAHFTPSSAAWPGDTVSEKIDLLIAVYPQGTVEKVWGYCGERRQQCVWEWKREATRSTLLKLFQNNDFHEKMKHNLYARNSSEISSRYIGPFTNCVVDSYRFKSAWQATLLNLLMLERNGNRIGGVTSSTAAAQMDKIQTQMDETTTSNSMNTSSTDKTKNAKSNLAKTDNTKLNLADNAKANLVKADRNDELIDLTNVTRTSSGRFRRTGSNRANSLEQIGFTSLASLDLNEAKLANLEETKAAIAMALKEEGTKGGDQRKDSPASSVRNQMELAHDLAPLVVNTVPSQRSSSQIYPMGQSINSPTRSDGSSSPDSPLSSNSPMSDVMSMFSQDDMALYSERIDAMMASAQTEDQLQMADIFLNELNHKIDNNMEAFKELVDVNKQCKNVFKIESGELKLLKQLRDFNLLKVIKEEKTIKTAQKTNANKGKMWSQQGPMTKKQDGWTAKDVNKASNETQPNRD